MRRAKQVLIAGVGLVLIGAATTAATAATRIVSVGQATTGSSSVNSRPSDLFMKSVVTRNGALGWHQLCPPLQRQVSEQAVRQQADSQKAAEAGQGLQLQLQFVRAVALPQGGQDRYYLVKAHRASDGWAGRRTYIVKAGPSGCVQDVQNTNG